MFFERLSIQPMSERVSDKLLFDASDVDRGIVDILLTLNSPHRWPAFNAVRHLNRAWRLHELDKTAALFYGITAEEEAATAVLQAVKHWNYPSAEKINPRNHVHKNAVVPFFEGFTRVLATIQDPPEMRFLLQRDEPSEPFVFELLPHPTYGTAWYRPDPPLGMLHRRSRDDGKTYVIEDFARGIGKILAERNMKSVGDYLRQRANLRNRLLYASSDGYPDYQGDIMERLKQFKRNVFALLRMFLLIDPHPKHQSLVVQAVSGYVSVITNLSGTFEFE